MTTNPVVFVVSDSVGETADLVARAVLSQFSDLELDVRRHVRIEDMQAAREVVEAARLQPTLIIYTIIIPEVRNLVRELAATYGIPAVDIMGPGLEAMERLTGRKPALKPGLVHKLDENYFRRVEAVEFAVRYDDGKDPRGCLKADVVLLGVSRCSKTPVSMYLAHNRVKVANQPLVPEVALPKELYQVPPHKVVGLRISPEKLAGIREERIRTIGLRSDANYANLQRILVELEYAEQVYQKLGCHVVDVTNKAVEETAVRVMEIVNKGAAFSD